MTFAIEPAVVVAINARVVGEVNCRVVDLGLVRLEGALARPLQSFGGQMAHPTLAGQAVALLEGVATAHSFQDGNKRTAWLCTTTYVELRGAPLRSTTAERAGGLVLDLVNKRRSAADTALQLAELME